MLPTEDSPLLVFWYKDMFGSPFYTFDIRNGMHAASHFKNEQEGSGAVLAHLMFGEEKKSLKYMIGRLCGLLFRGITLLVCSTWHLASPDEWIVGGKICRQHFLNKHLTCKGYKLQEHWIGTFLNFLTLKSSYDRTDWIHFCTYSNHTGMHYKLQRNWISSFLKLIYASENFELFLKIDFFTTYSLA